MLLALGITKPITRTVIILQKSQFDCNLVYLPNIMCTYKVKKSHFCLRDTVFKNTTSTKKPQPNHFKQTERTLKPYSGLFFFERRGERRGSEGARHCPVFDQKTLEQSKNSFFKSD